MNLGIDPNTNLVFEGESRWGRPVLPSPPLYPATIFNELDGHPVIIKSNDFIRLVFREDSYEPVSRIRRGRFYHVPDNVSGREQWYVSPHPLLPEDCGRVNQQGVVPKELYSFRRFSVNNLPKGLNGQQNLVALGSDGAFTIWAIVAIEKGFSREETVTLKARQTYGALPVLIYDKIPEKRRAKVLECLDILQEDLFRAGPASVVDRARDAASAILRAYVGDEEGLQKDADLGPLIRKLKEGKGHQNVVNAADIIRLFHSRSKPSFQERMPEVRALREQDAELAVQCVGCILCDLGNSKGTFLKFINSQRDARGQA